MATFIDIDKVKYTCSCKRNKSLAYLYFCKHCVTLKCKECVLHEIDPKYYCTHCFDNKTSKEASSLKYRCSNCFNCPLCLHTLTTRASSIQKKTDPTPPTAGGEQVATAAQPQKVFYLVCGCCRWSTRDANIPDATSTPGGWKLQENPNSKRISELLEYYKSISMKEKHEKEKKKYPYGTKRKIFQSPVANDMLGILTPFQKLLQQQPQNLSETDIQLKPSTTVTSFEPLSDDYYTQSLSVNSVTTMNQRLLNPEFQVDKCNKLYPLNKFFFTKESKRCNVCDHNVIKPENNIASIKFKLHQMAIFMIPEIRIVSIPEWKLNEANEVILSITNKCESEVNVTLVSSNSDIADIIFTDETLVVDRQDAKTPHSILKPTDNEKYVCYRKDNKIAIFCHVRPKSDKGNIECTFEMKHSYYGMSADLQSAPVMQMLTQHVTVNFGSFKSTNVIARPKYIDECLANTNKNLQTKA